MRRLIRAYCPHCRCRQSFVPVVVRHWLHLLLVIVSGGLWLISYVAVWVGASIRPWRCEHCGWHKPEFLTRSRQSSSGQVPRNPRADAKA